MIKPDPDHRQRISDEDAELERIRKNYEAFQQRHKDFHERSDRAPEPGTLFKTVFYLSAFLFAVAVIAACIGLGVVVFYIFKP